MAQTRGNLAYKKAQPAPQNEEFKLEEFRRANSAFADQFFAAYNADERSLEKKELSSSELDYSFAIKAEPEPLKRARNKSKKQPSYSFKEADFKGGDLTLESSEPDFSFAKKKIESYYDDTRYDYDNKALEEVDLFSERSLNAGLGNSNRVTNPLSTASRKIGRWFEKQQELSDYEQSRLQVEMAERSSDERFLLVEEMGPAGFDTYESANYRSRSPRAYSLLAAEESAESLLRPSMTAGNLALIPEPLDDQELLKKLEERKAAEEDEKAERSLELEALEQKINLRRLYRALGVKRLAAIMTYLSLVLAVGGIFIGLLTRQAAIVEANFAIADKRAMVHELTAKNHENYEEIMEMYDLNELRLKAMTELGLRPASQSQRIHIYLPEADRCILYSNEIGEKNLVKEDIIAFDYLNYQKLEHYFDGVAGIYD